MDTDILIIGGGASGLTAAITAGRLGRRVLVLEHKDRPGKKILATGNGKCNYTNERLYKGCYHSDNPSFPKAVLDRFGCQDTIAFFKGLGIYPYIKNGCVYPHSEQASSVLSVLSMELAHLNIPVRCSEHAKDIQREGRGYCVTTEKNAFTAERVILCTGGKASCHLGSDGSGYRLARILGHHIIEPVPALIGLAAEEKSTGEMAGIRVKAEAALIVGGKALKRERGEVQLTSYGISGIPVFQFSRFAAKALQRGEKTEVLLDFFPELTHERLYALLKARGRESYKTAGGFLVGLVQDKLCRELLRRSGIHEKKAAARLSDKEYEGLTKCLKGLCFTIRDTNGFEQAQVTAGGVNTKEVDRDTLESRFAENIYFAGELLDVDACCGGYNLQWAWSSGAVAGLEASRRS